MKGTSIFQFKSWPKIHQPLPRTPRESQQLLNALTSSFRSQLDQAYPASKPPHNESDRQPLNTDSSLHATDQHLHNILDNPLFRIVPPKATSLDHHAGKNISQDKRLAENPMGLFDEMAASGAVTPFLLTKCLKSQLLLVRSSDNGEVSETMKTSRTASRVVDWFWASDGASRQMLLRWKATSSSLAKFMVAEGLQDTIICWLEMLMSYDLGGHNGRMNEVVAQQTFNNFLVGFIEAEIRYGKGLGSAFQHYVHVCNMHSISRQKTHLPGKTMLLEAGARLNRAALELKPLNELVSVTTYDEYQSVISTLSVPNSLISASISLCHPKNPDPQPLIRFVETLSPTKFLSWNSPRRDAVLRIACDALHLLIDRKNIREAIHLAHLIQQFFPNTTADSTAEGSRLPISSKEQEDLLSRLEFSLA
ncbi:hypothetical protein N7478_003326 [Penicillium angulare]|uniref:uncharacterized protein n=1 Tax=Penicillium angulare TaxID=116970 RepID=UPI0025418CBE|nr:uncharacterized protein N7478_003326 [Penicillium angulare]KAJ5287640.1 hypothetical protein N7478_003326 [Penicillium angulare]